MYKVFIENTPIFFEKGPQKYPQVLKNYLPELKTDHYLSFVTAVSKHSSITVSSPDPEFLFTTFFKDFERIQAAGGLVYHPVKDAFLFIYRNGKWDLPKGKIEKNETLTEAAIREVEEECGIRNLKLQQPLLTTYHTFFKYKKYVLKPTFWYAMEYTGNEELIPQIEEGITAVKWIKMEAFDSVLKNTYGNIVDVLNTLK